MALPIDIMDGHGHSNKAYHECIPKEAKYHRVTVNKS